MTRFQGSQVRTVAALTTSPALTACVIGVMLFAVCVAPSLARGASASSHTLTVYSVAVHEQFINNNDDEARGDVNNPFGTHNTTAAATKENGNGPFPGDEAIFTFNLYTSASLKTTAGSAVFVCQYYFDRNAFCHASYQLDGGVLVGAGALSFNTTNFALAITGGSGKFSNQTGDVQAVPSAKHALKLTFALDT